MGTTMTNLTTRSFPGVRPRITITPSRARTFAVDCPELRWWYVAPLLGDEAIWTTYEGAGWSLTGYTLLRAARPARIHGREAVDIDVTVRERDPGPRGRWQQPRTKTVIADLTAERFRWLAIIETMDGRKDVFTFLDEDFELDFGEGRRRIEDTGRVRQNKDGSFRIRRRGRSPLPDTVGAGMFRVGVGRRAFTCLRAWEADTPMKDGEAAALEAYLTRKGRTVLSRHYRTPRWGIKQDWAKAWTGGRPWDKAFPDHARVVINNRTYVHLYDCLTGIALGLA